MSTTEQTSSQLWGGETTKAVANFQISGETVPA
jgi:fumarate hydratase class II